MIIFGWRATIKLIVAIPQSTGYCCSTESAKRVVRRKKWFTIFFIPIIPYSTKYYMECVACGKTTKVSLDEMKELGITV